MRKMYPSIGDTRTKTGFLWFPIIINGEQRWLEKATWIEECQRMAFYDNGCVFPYPSWEPIAWVDSE